MSAVSVLRMGAFPVCIVPGFVGGAKRLSTERLAESRGMESSLRRLVLWLTHSLENCGM